MYRLPARVGPSFPQRWNGLLNSAPTLMPACPGSSTMPGPVPDLPANPAAPGTRVCLAAQGTLLDPGLGNWSLLRFAIKASLSFAWIRPITGSFSGSPVQGKIGGRLI